MKKIIVSMCMSLDGFIAGENGELDWIFKLSDDEVDKYQGDLLDSIDVILIGRGMHQEFLDYWPDYQTDFAKRINILPKIVFSNTLEKVESKSTNVRLINKNIVEEVEKLKHQSGKDIVMYGGAGLVSSFTELGLIDEYRLLVIPVVLGNGIPLFKNMKERVELKLLNARTYKSGVVGLYYVRG